MPILKFDRAMVSEIAKAAGVSEEAVFLRPRTEDTLQIFFWTAKMSRKELTSLTGPRKRHVVANMLKDFNAEGWLTKADPGEAQPHQLFPLIGKRAKLCTDCGYDLYTSQEQYIGKCEMCCPK
jgi:hypothetical protein